MKQNESLSLAPNTCNVGRNLKSTTYLMLIWKFYKWLHTCPKVVLTLIDSRRQGRKIASKQFLYLGSSFSNMLYQNAPLK
jgi:hypothetical protein